MAFSNRALCVLNWPGSPEFETISLRLFRGESICNRFMAGWLIWWMNISIWKGFGIMWPAENCRAATRCDQNGPPTRRSEPDWQLEGAYLNGYVTDEQRSRRPIFIVTLRAAASWLFFRVARSSRIDLDMLVATASPARTALKNSQLTRQPPDERHAYFGDRTLE